MLLEDLKSYLLVNSLQYFIGENEIEVDNIVLENLVKRTISFYSNWRPLLIQEKTHIEEYSTVLKTTIDGSRILNVQNIYYIEPMLGGIESTVDFNWEYNKDNGLFRTQVQGTYYFEFLVENKLENLDFTDSEFLDMIQGQYLMYIGSSRKSFTLVDQPFENDGEDLYQSGKELWDNTLEELQNSQQSWYMAIN